MKPPPFGYAAPTTLEEALILMREYGDEARPLAGGQSLIPLLSLRLARPRHLIDLAGIRELGSVFVEGPCVVIGAMVTQRAAQRHDVVCRCAPLLVDALPLVGHAAIRARGTIGGSLSHADPTAELPAVAVALDAELVARSRERGRRAIAAGEFFTGSFTTALEPDEVLTQIRIRKPAAATGGAIAEVARRHGDLAMAGAVAVVRLAEDEIADARVVLIGVADGPVRVTEAETMLIGAVATDELFAEVADKAAWAVSPPGDAHASSAYRRRLARVVTGRTLRLAADRAREAG